LIDFCTDSTAQLHFADISIDFLLEEIFPHLNLLEAYSLMARFVYRLQKVFELRERKKKEQEQRVVDAQKAVRKVEQAIEEKHQERRQVKEHMLSVGGQMLEAGDRFLHHLNQQIDVLREDLRQAELKLEMERKLLLKAHADLEALVKHKEKMLEEWLEEEKIKELKMLDEVAGQRYFRLQQDKLLEELEDAADMELEDAD
jgi:flagellar protein FliJ